MAHKIKIPVAAKVTNMTGNQRDCNHCALSGLNNSNGLPCKDVVCQGNRKKINFKSIGG